MRIQKKAKLVGKILFYVFFFAVLLLVVGMMISKIGNRVFFLGNRATIWVMTDSMEDAIPAESYIQIRKADASEIREGDVITFYSDDPMLQGHLNTHRVVEIVDDGEAFITKGDNNVINDAYPARAEAVIGVYEKNLGFLTAAGRLFQTKIGLLCIFVLIAVVMIFSFAWEPFKKMLKKEKDTSSSDEQK